jgi:soluble lytic murein transglycosylase
LPVLAALGILAAAVQADPAGAAPAEKTAIVAAKDNKDKTSAAKAKTSAAKDKPAAAKGKSSKDKAAKDKAAKDKTAKDKAGKDKAAKDKAATGKSDSAKALPSKEPESDVPPPLPSAELTALKDAVAAARRGDDDQAENLKKSIGDPVAHKLIEWAILRSDETESVAFSRYMAFIGENPSWPAVGMLRRRAEATLWSDRRDPAFVRTYFSRERPTTSKGRFALARALLLQGDRAGARELVRATWRNDNFSGDLENLALDVFRDLLTPADHKARMDMRLYAEDIDGAMRSANRLGGGAVAIAKARAAVIRKASNAKALLDALPSESRNDIGVIFSRAQWLRRDDKPVEAAQLILALPRDPEQAIDGDQWWIERRLASRKLLDLGDAEAAYRVASGAAPPSRDNYRAESQFTAGWIALRFLNDPAAALAHFARIADGISNPITLARAGYWQGRAAEALGRTREARAHYEAAARYSTAYYGQIARARLGHKDIVLRPAPKPAGDRHDPATRTELVRAVELLYAIGQRDLIAGSLADLGDRLNDAATLAAVGEVAARHRDARAVLLLGKAALARGLPLEHYAFPTLGIPDYRPIGPAIEPAVVYAIARQESTFNPKTISSARAMGLMQVTPAAGRYVAKKFGARYDEKRLLSDQTYNVQLGAAELGDLYVDYRGSHILTFAGYNAGRGRVREWIGRFGDPRDPKVDPIDWVERIPFSETRNYVQRVLENLQVYRVFFGGGSRLMIEADLHRGATAN